MCSLGSHYFLPGNKPAFWVISKLTGFGGITFGVGLEPLEPFTYVDFGAGAFPFAIVLLL
jgi:hypothetical protein